MTVEEYFDWLYRLNYPTDVTALEVEKVRSMSLKEYLDWVLGKSNKSDNLGEL